MNQSAIDRVVRIVLKHELDITKLSGVAALAEALEQAERDAIIGLAVDGFVSVDLIRARNERT
jgi:hypothetical protein